MRKKLILFEQEILSINDIFISIGNHVQDNMTYVDQYVRSKPFPNTTSFSTNRINVDADFEAMANDKKLINYMSRFAVQWTYHVMFSDRLNKMALELIDELTLELENLK